MGLNIKKAELLPSGEVRLGNGKTIGTRRWNYLYKQKLKWKVAVPKNQQEMVHFTKTHMRHLKLMQCI